VRTDPFLDEIAIDFPSTGRFVERVRHTFLGARALDCDDTLKAEVLVSSEEAYRGAILPLDIELRGTCSVCGGRGETWEEPCLECAGSGDALVPCSVRVFVPPGVAHGACLRLRVRAPHAAPVRVEVTVAIRNLRV
jgi:hypothetical protein